MPGGVFERIVCGVDGSPASLEAVRQSDVLLVPGGRLLLVSAVDPLQAVHFQVAPTAVHAARHALEDVEKLDREAVEALEQVRTQVTRATDVATLEKHGTAASCLLDAVAAEEATLLAVGTHGRGRTAGILLGSVATRVLDRAPCSVLVARRPPTGEWSPRVIVAGVDGSEEADTTLRACQALESRFDAELRVVSIEERRPADALVEAAAGADLLAVGGRGRHRRLGLGSVSEHVAHHAPCSVLVVRPDAPAADA